MQDTLIFRPLGLQSYEPIWHAMQHFTANRDQQTLDEIWWVEHPPVFTLGLNGKAEHLLNTAEIPVVQIDRGGQVTYHGPGQLIFYLLIDLQRRHIGVRQLVTYMEQAIIEVLAEYSIVGNPRKDAPGVYVDDAKIAALGLRIRHGCSYHGLSLNVEMDLSPFTRINPCGYKDMPVTQMSSFCKITEMEVIASLLLKHLQALLGYNGHEIATDIPHESETDR